MAVADIQKQHLLDPDEWISSADALLASAALFEPQIRKYWQSKGAERKSYESFLKGNMMLAGFALENALKALIVQNQHEEFAKEFDTKHKLPKVLTTHDLTTLAQRARLCLAEDGTRELLDRLTRHSVWAGRYPVPLRLRDFPAEDFFNLGPNFVPMTGFVSSDWRNVQILFRRAKQVLEQRKNDQTTGCSPISGRADVI